MLVRKFIAAKALSVCLMATPAYAAATGHAPAASAVRAPVAAVQALALRP